MGGHDIIVIGASAGGIEALSRVVSHLPADLPATLFVVLHLPATGPSALPHILSRNCPLPAVHPTNGEPIRPGRIYVAPPDAHLLVAPGTVRLTRDPRENGFRPAIDALFRSAAMTYGPRVTGVVLSGALDDGTAGLLAVKKHGGIAIVQDPDEAIHVGMPRSAIANVPVDYILPSDGIARILTQLAHEAVEVQGAPAMPVNVDYDAQMVQRDKAEQERGERPDEPSVFTCPDCGGVLWEIDEKGSVRFQCHVGHRYSTESMLDGQSVMLEAALWTAVRALEEHASLSYRMATRMRDLGRIRSAERFDVQAQSAKQRADLVRQALRGSEDADAPDSEDVASAPHPVSAQPGN